MKVYKVKGNAIWKGGRETLTIQREYVVSVKAHCDARNAIMTAHGLAQAEAPRGVTGAALRWVDFDAQSVEFVTETDN